MQPHASGIRKHGYQVLCWVAYPATQVGIVLYEPGHLNLVYAASISQQCTGHFSENHMRTNGLALHLQFRSPTSSSTLVTPAYMKLYSTFIDMSH